VQAATKSRERVPEDVVVSTPIPVPSLDEQQHIVAKLDEQMAAVNRAEKAIAEQQAATLAFKRATLQTALDPARHSDWPALTIGQLYQSIPIGGTPPRGIAAYFDGSFPWVSIADMNNTNLISDTREHLSESGIKNSNVKLVRAGSLLFSFKLTVGKVAFAGVDLYTNEAIAAFEPIPRVNLQYLRYALPFAADLTTDSNTFGARMLNKEKISSLSIPLPSTAEQRRVTDILDDVSLYSDRVFESVASRLELLRRLRSRLLKAAFSGEI
jgi:type I restriction enzyme S subunit